MPMTPEYIEALDRVKIGEFIKRGIKLRGVVHIGANDGYEVQWYQKLGIEILCFEPGIQAVKRFTAAYPDVAIQQMALGNIHGNVQFHVTDGDGGSTMLPEPKKLCSYPVIMARWADTPLCHLSYNACVIDVQGMELDVLRGMDEHIQDFDCFVVECSSRPVYKGEASAEEVIRFMEKNGFSAISPICEHDDILFCKTALLDVKPVPLTKPIPKGRALNCGSGQRPFDREFGWINVDISERWNPDLVADWNNLSMFDDNTMDLVVSHHSMEHAGCGEACGFIRESYRVLKPGGSLLVFVPDMKALAKRWLEGGLTDQIYFTNVYGAYMGDEADRHKFGFTGQSLVDELKRTAPWHDVHAFNWRQIAGADIARDWWILGMEAVK